MKVRSAIKVMCKGCYIVRRGKYAFVYCKLHPKHKQRQGFHTLANLDLCCGCGEPGLFHFHNSITAAVSATPVIAAAPITANRIGSNFSVQAVRKFSSLLLRPAQGSKMSAFATICSILSKEDSMCVDSDVFQPELGI